MYCTVKKICAGNCTNKYGLNKLPINQFNRKQQKVLYSQISNQCSLYVLIIDLSVGPTI